MNKFIEECRWRVEVWFARRRAKQAASVERAARLRRERQPSTPIMTLVPQTANAPRPERIRVTVKKSGKKRKIG